MARTRRSKRNASAWWLSGAALSAAVASLAYCVPGLDRREERAPSPQVRADRARRNRATRAGPTAPARPGRTAPPPSRWTAPSPAPSGPQGALRLRVTFIDVGQGDAALLESGDGHAAMIDAGPPEARAHIREVLAAHGVTRLDWLMFSHPHLDHIGGGIHVLNAMPVANVVDPAVPHPIATYDRLLARIQALGVSFTPGRAGTRLALGAGVSVEILGPRDPLISGTRSDVNSNSIVARVTAGNVRVLFVGDAERETEERLLADAPGSLAADVLKVAHHGSRYASTAPFIAAVAPRFAVISCAAGNDYGHPGLATLETLSRSGVGFFRTDVQGDVTLTTDGASVSVSGAREASPAALMTPGVSRSRSDN